MDRWHGKHPIPWDMFFSFSNISGKDLTWYFSNWFMTPHFMDISVDKVTPITGGYTLSIKNVGGYAIPFDIIVEYSDSTMETTHQTAGAWERDQQATIINIKTKKKITSLKLDSGIFMDADDKNNTWGNKKEKVLSSAELDKYTGVYSSAQIPIKLNFTREGSNLVCEPTGQDKMQLTNTGKDSFSVEPAGVVIVFDTTKNEMTLKQGVSTFTFKKEK